MKSKRWIMDKTVKLLRSGYDFDEANEEAYNKALRKSFRNNPYNQKKKNNNKNKGRK